MLWKILFINRKCSLYDECGGREVYRSFVLKRKHIHIILIEIGKVYVAGYRGSEKTVILKISILLLSKFALPSCLARGCHIRRSRLGLQEGRSLPLREPPLPGPATCRELKTQGPQSPAAGRGGASRGGAGDRHPLPEDGAAGLSC